MQSSILFIYKIPTTKWGYTNLRMHQLSISQSPCYSSEALPSRIETFKVRCGCPLSTRYSTGLSLHGEPL
jgi:hypothetical protein